MAGFLAQATSINEDPGWVQPSLKYRWVISTNINGVNPPLVVNTGSKVRTIPHKHGTYEQA